MKKNLKFLVTAVAATAAWMLVAVPAAQATHECTNVLVAAAQPAQLISPETRVLVSPAQPRTLISPSVRVAPVYTTETRYDSYVGDACCKYTHTNRWRGGRTYTCVSYSGPVSDCGEHGPGFLGHSSSGGLVYPKTYTYSYNVSVLVSAGYTIPAVYSEATPAVYTTVAAVYSQPVPARYECRAIPHSTGGGSSSSAPATTTYTLSYNANGGSGAPGSASWTSDLTPPTIASGTSMNAPSGKVFSTWNTRSDGNGSTYSPGSRAPAATTTLYATWVNAAVTSYTVSYNANGGSGAPAARSVSAGGSFTVASGSSMTPPAGKTFTGWRTSGGMAYTVGSSYSVTGDLILIAQWATASGPVRPS